MDLKKTSSKWALVSTVGLMFPACIIIGYGWGYLMDRFLKTKPWFTVIFSILGVVAAFLNLLRLEMLLRKEEENDGKDGE